MTEWFLGQLDLEAYADASLQNEATESTRGGGGSNYSVAGGGVNTAHPMVHPKVASSRWAARPEIYADHIGDLARTYVSRLWAQDWDSPEDAIYDAW